MNLIIAARNGDIDTINKLLDEGANPNIWSVDPDNFINLLFRNVLFYLEIYFTLLFGNVFYFILEIYFTLLFRKIFYFII